MNPNHVYTLKTIIIIAAVIMVICGATYFYTVYDPADNIFPKCPFLTLTGYTCPGCGSQRAIHQLLHLNITEAFKFNPLLILSIPYIITILILELLKSKNRFYYKWYNKLTGSAACMVILTIIIAYWVSRNIFGF